MRSQKFRIIATLAMQSTLCMLFSFLAGTQVYAQARHVTVDADAMVMAKPDRLTFALKLQKSGASSMEAKAKVKAMKKTFDAVFNDKKFKGLSKKTISISLSNHGFLGGGAMPPVPDGVAPVPKDIGAGPGGEDDMGEDDDGLMVTETIEMSIDGIGDLASQEVEELMVEIVGELKKLKLQPTGFFSTSLQDDSAYKKKVMKQAMDKAREKAKTLAELSGGKIGKVISVEQTEFTLLNSKIRDLILSRINEVGEFFGETLGEVSLTRRVFTKIRVRFELKD